MDRIRNGYIRGKLRVIAIEEKNVNKCCLRWFVRGETNQELGGSCGERHNRFNESMASNMVKWKRTPT